MWKFLAVLALSTGLSSLSIAFEHEDSLVEFVEYREGVIADARKQNKPYFLLFSAQWCHWCHEFAEQTLVRQDVADYLNDKYTNVFIDVDIHNAAYVKYRASGLPYTVFLNPDGSIYYKYSGTLYGDDFLDVIKQVAGGVGAGRSAFGPEITMVSYEPPLTFAKEELLDLPDVFIGGIEENFDPEQHGLGKGQKSVLPRTFLYVLDSASANGRVDVVQALSLTLERAIDTIYDPVEGGFFRYAETRDWRIPHYEKFADLNAGAALLLYRLNAVRPSAELVRAANEITEYLGRTLYDPKVGSFLSFQVADTTYYFLAEEQRSAGRKPKVMDKIFADRLAATLIYLIELIGYANDPELTDKMMRSVDFLGEMVMSRGNMSRYYLLPEEKWLGQGGLADHAYLALLFANAAARFENPQYQSVARRVIQSAIAHFYDEQQRVFLDPSVDTSSSAEYLMEMNGLLALAMMGSGDVPGMDQKALVRSVLKYYSGMGDVLEDRFWDGVEWEFAESYVPFLLATEKYLKLNQSP